MDLEKLLKEEINKLNDVINELSGVNLFTELTPQMRKKIQGKVNKGYSKIVDVKMDLEKIIKKLGE